jgi:hypothetical protein
MVEIIQFHADHTLIIYSPNQPIDLVIKKLAIMVQITYMPKIIMIPLLSKRTKIMISLSVIILQHTI